MVRPASQRFAPAEKWTGGSDYAGVGIRILIVDDIEAWHPVYSAILRGRANCHIVGVALDGLEAIQKSRELKPDIVLLDVGLGPMDGFEAARQIGDVSPASRVIFLGTVTPSDLIGVVLTIGAYGYIAKRDVVLELVPALETVAEGKRFFSRSLS